MAIRHLPTVGRPTSEPAPAGETATEEPPAKWLTAAELDSWMSLVRLMTWLPWSIDQQLTRHSHKLD
jgi:hypothetical protein